MKYLSSHSIIYIIYVFKDDRYVDCITVGRGICMLSADVSDHINPLFAAFVSMPTMLDPPTAGNKVSKKLVARKNYANRSLKLALLKIIRAMWPGNTAWHLTDLCGSETWRHEFNAKRIDVMFSK